MKLSVLLGLLAASITLTNCDKNDERPSLDAQTQALTSRKWRISAHVIIEKKVGQPDTVDAYATYSSWAKDNTYQFYADNTFEVDEGTVKRQPNDPQKVKGIWRFESDQQNIAIGLNKVDPLGTSSSKPDNSITFQLLKLDNDVFRFGCQCSPQSSFKTLIPK